MKFKIAFFLLVFVLSFLTSCRSTRQVVEKSNLETKLINETVVSYTDTTLFTPVSETQLKLPIGLLQFKDPLNGNILAFKPQTFFQKNGNASVKVRIERDTILVDAKCDSLALEAKIKEKYHSRIERIRSDLQNLETRTTGVPVFKTILFILGAFIIGFVVAFILKTFKII